MTWKRKNKYNAKRTTYGGYGYDSNLEARVAERLDWRLKANDIKSWERQVGVDLFEQCSMCGGWERKKRWKVDFKIEHHDGSFELMEAKGFATKDFKEKEKMLKKMIERGHESMKNTIYTLVTS